MKKIMIASIIGMMAMTNVSVAKDVAHTQEEVVVPPSNQHVNRIKEIQEKTKVDNKINKVVEIETQSEQKYSNQHTNRIEEMRRKHR